METIQEETGRQMADWTRSEMKTEGWQLRVEEDQRYMIGCAKIPKEEVDSVMQRSGHNHVYLQRLARDLPPEQPIARMKRDKEETDDE